ncbi:thioredoxin reductase [Candidatus Bathyarchaeota archaeon]|nr:thioredoxin reductase [Candidatus Bathyarchaeota archaeon]
MFDLAVIGGGPAGLTAAIYGQRYGMRTVVLAGVVGGLVADNPLIENYPGFRSITGADLSLAMQDHATSLGAEIKAENVVEVKKKGKTFTIKTESGTEVEARTLVLAHGLKRRKLGARGEDKFIGKGISYCATCDGPFFKGKPVAVVGGGNSAALAALVLGEFASHVYVIYRREKFFRMQPYYLRKIEKVDKIEPLFKEEVAEFLGKEKIEKVKLEGGRVLDVSGVFIEIGFEPELPFKTDLKLTRDEKGFLKVDAGMRTSVPGVFAAGDISTGSDYFWQVATAVGEGAIAARSAYEHLLKE